MTLVLETDGLILRRIKREDAEALVRVINRPEIAATTLNVPHPYSLDDAYTWIDSVNDPERQTVSLNLNVFLKDPAELVGGVGLSSISEKHRKAELGYWCAVEHWNKGITTEAVRRMVRYGFDELNLERIYAICFSTNPASARVMEKAGMLHEGTARHEFIKDGERVDFHHYACLSSD